MMTSERKEEIRLWRPNAAYADCEKVLMGMKEELLAKLDEVEHKNNNLRPVAVSEKDNAEKIAERLDEAQEDVGVFMGDAQLAEHNLKLALDVVTSVRQCVEAFGAVNIEDRLGHLASCEYESLDELMKVLKRHDEGVI